MKTRGSLKKEGIRSETAERGGKTEVELLAESGNEETGYDRKEKIDKAVDVTLRFLPTLFWGINTFPLWLILLSFSGLATILFLPFSLIVWFFIGDRPVRRMQPSNFFYLILRGLIEGMEANYEELPLNLDKETPFMRMVFQMSVDLRFFSECHYKNIYNFYLLGKTHPVTGLKCYIHVRMLALLLYGLVTWPYILIIMKIWSCNASMQPEVQNFKKI